MARSRSSRKRREDRRGALMIAGVVLILLTLAGLVAYLSRTRVERDRISFCPVGGARGVTAVIVDRTDELSPVQQASLLNHLRRIREETQQDHLLMLFAIGDSSKQMIEPVFAACKPPSGADPLIENPEFVRAQFEEKFSGPFQEAVNSLLMIGAPSAESPILETIQAASVLAFGGAKDEVPKQLIIASDMIQNTKGFSQYRGLSSFEEFQGLGYAARVQARLRGAEVEVLYLKRTTEPSLQGTRHVQFWRDYVAGSEGTLIRVTSVEG